MALDSDVQALRTPPHSIEAEQSVLGALIIDNNAIDKVADLLKSEDFYNEGHRLIYEHINMLGRYSFAVPEEVARGELRPLRNPDDDL